MRGDGSSVESLIIIAFINSLVNHEDWYRQGADPVPASEDASTGGDLHGQNADTVNSAKFHAVQITELSLELRICDLSSENVGYVREQFS